MGRMNLSARKIHSSCRADAILYFGADVLLSGLIGLCERIWSEEVTE